VCHTFAQRMCCVTCLMCMSMWCGWSVVPWLRTGEDDDVGPSSSDDELVGVAAHTPTFRMRAPGSSSDDDSDESDPEAVSPGEASTARYVSPLTVSCNPLRARSCHHALPMWSPGSCLELSRPHQALKPWGYMGTGCGYWRHDSRAKFGDYAC